MFERYLMLKGIVSVVLLLVALFFYCLDRVGAKADQAEEVLELEKKNR